MALPGEQDDLVAAVAAANPNTVVVLNTGSPVTMPWLDDVPAVLQLWFPGQEIGDAPGRRADRRRRARRAAADDVPAASRGHAGVRPPPGHGRAGRVRRGAVHRPPLVRPGGHRAAVPVRLRARLHDVHARHGCRRRWRRARRHRRRRRSPTPATGPAARWSRSTSSRRAATRPGRCATSPVSARIELGAGRGAARSASTLDRRAFASWIDGEWVVPPGEYTIHVGRSSADLAAPARHRRLTPHPSRVSCARRVVRDARMAANTRMGRSEAPVDRVEAGGDERGVGPGERLGAEEAVVRRQRRRVRRLDDRVPGRVDQRLLAPGVAAPQDEHDRVRPCRRRCG